MRLRAPPLERAAGKPLPELARDRLFEPLGMSSTRWQPSCSARAGRFASEERAGAVYTLVVEGGRLALRAPVQPNGTLDFLGGDSFVLATEWFVVRFDFGRGAAGEVDGFTVSTGEASGIVFRRASDCGGAGALTPSR